MRNTLTYVFCLLLVFLPACNMLSPAQRDAGKIALQEAFEQGTITADQRDRAMDALDGHTIDWSEILLTGGAVVFSVLTGVPLAVNRATRRVNAMRGPTEAQRQAARANPA